MQNTITTPREFFEFIVKPDVDDFFSDQSNIRKAFHACMALDHLTDWIAKSKRQNHGSFKEHIYKECPSTKMVRDICVNSKHFPPDRNGTPKIIVGTTAKSIMCDDVTINIDDMLGMFDDYGASPQLLAKTGDNQGSWITILINEVYVYWKDQYNKNEW